MNQKLLAGVRPTLHGTFFNGLSYGETTIQQDVNQQYMPSKRELLGSSSRGDSGQWADVRWKRICAFIGGGIITALYVRVNLFQYLSDWIAAASGALPVGMLLYGGSSQSWRYCAKLTAGIAFGVGVGTAL